MFLTVANVAFGQVSNVSASANSNTNAHKLSLPAGFTADVVAQGVVGARHSAVTRQGDIYVKLSKLKDGKGIVYLRDSNNDGRLEIQTAFGDYPGTGIFIKSDYLYASSNDDAHWYKLNNTGEVIHTAAPQKIVVGLVNRNRDNSKATVVDNKNNLYVSVGSYLTSCLVDPKSKQAPYPCPMLYSVGGIWQFKTNKSNQQYKEGIRYATGFKNTVGLTWNAKTNSLFVMNHGSDQLHELFPQY